jgi:FkbM family methyltransferase
MLKSQLNKLKKLIVFGSGNWFYPTKKLPIGTHFALFIKHRVFINMNVVFDVGANVGHFSKELYQYFPKAKFCCFEPFPETFEKLDSSLKGPNFSHFQLALGDRSEMISVSINDSDRSDTNSLIESTQLNKIGTQVSIQVITLDEYLEKYLCTQLTY